MLFRSANQFGSSNEYSTIIGDLPEVTEPNLEEVAKEEKLPEESFKAKESSIIKDNIAQLPEHLDTTKSLGRFLKKMLGDVGDKSIPKTYRSFLSKAVIDRILVPALVGSDLKVVTKTNDEAVALLKREGITGGKSYKGAYDSATNTIYLNTDTGLNVETLFHELLHAALDTSLDSRMNAKMEATVEAMITPIKKAWERKYPNENLPLFNTEPRKRAKELFAWGLSNFDLILLLDRENNAEVTAAVAADPTHPLRVVKTFMVNWIQDIVNWALGRAGRQEKLNDSILAFLVTTAADNASRNPKQSQGDLSFQIDMSSVNEATPQTVFNSVLSRSTNNSESHKRHLERLFLKEVDQVQRSKIPLLKERAVNAVEALISLEQSGITITPHKWEGLFPMSEAEAYLFNNYRNIIQTGLDEFGIAATEIADLYTSAKSKITVKDFLLEGEEESNPISIGIAKSKYDAVFNSTVVDSSGRSTYLADFASLARTNEDFRRALTKKVGTRTLQQYADSSIGSKIMDLIHRVTNWIAGAYTGSRKSGTYKGKIDKISKHLAVSEFKAKHAMERQVRKSFDASGKVYATYAAWMGKFHSDITNSDAVSAVAEAVSTTRQVTTDALTGKNNVEQAKLYNTFINNLHHTTGKWFTRLVETEFTTAKDYNKEIKRAIFMKSKAVAGAADSSKKAIQSIMKDVLGAQNEKTLSALTDGVLRTDLSVFSDWPSTDLMKMFSSSTALQNKITDLENTLRSHSAGEALINASHSLGHFQIHHRGTEETTFPNAEAIVLNVSRIFGKVLTQEVSTVDQLASLVAIQQLPSNTKERVLQLNKDKPEAIQKLLELHSVQKLVELNGRYNHSKYAPLKGSIVESFDPSKDIKVVPTSEVADLKHDGYIKKGELKRNLKGDPSNEKMNIMYSTTGGLIGWVQGAFSSATNQKGIKNLDGRTITNGYDSYDEMQKHSAKVTTHFKNSIRASNIPKSNRTNKEDGTVAVLTDSGTVIGQQYTINLKDKQRYLGSKNSVLEALPSMYGHNIVVTNTAAYNKKVNEAMKVGYEIDREKGELHKYMEISPKAPTVEGKEAYRMMPPEARESARELWGTNKFYVKSSLYEMTYGYRKVSVANIIKANSDSPQWAKSLMRNTLGLFLTDAQLINGITTGGRMMEEAVSEIKDMIVVRSISVLIDNLLSNSVQLVLENKGMTIVKAVKYTLEGLRLAKRYQENSSKLHRLEHELSIERDPSKAKVMKSNIAVLLEEQRKNPAKELIDGGALTAIVEDLGQPANPYSYAAKIGNKFDQYNSQLPESVQWVTGNIVAGKQSEIYRTAYKFTQLGDFGSRYAMYKNALEQGTMDKEFGDRIMEAFVMYDLPSNRYLEWLGGTGTLWFMKYFLRIQAIILRNIKENPRKVAEFAAMVNMAGVDIPNYYQALFLTNPVTNKMGQLDYAEKGIESLPIVHLYDWLQ